jgi:hypothetical protein
MNTPFRLPTRPPFLRGEWQKQIRVGKLDIPDLKLIVPKRLGDSHRFGPAQALPIGS